VSRHHGNRRNEACRGSNFLYGYFELTGFAAAFLFGKNQRRVNISMYSCICIAQKLKEVTMRLDF